MAEEYIGYDKPKGHKERESLLRGESHDLREDADKHLQWRPKKAKTILNIALLEHLKRIYECHT